MAMIANTVSVANLFHDSNVYVIPTFQRPYAWEESQWDELIEDIRNAADKKSSPYHYFAPIHVVQIFDPDTDFWKLYTDEENEDITNLAISEFRSEYGDLNVFLVIDGQQRLITFYSLLSQYFKERFVTLSGGVKVPNVILNSRSDQIVFRNLLGLDYSNKPVSHVSRAQSRLKSLFDKLSVIISSDPCFSPKSSCHKFLTSSRCETLLVQLDATARLAAFMTLNDRGKRLTNLEKTKSLFMEIDDNQSLPAPSVVNNAFGRLYQSLESGNAYVNDDEFLKQMSMTLWEGGNLAIISGTDWPDASGKYRNSYIHEIGSDQLYENYFKKIPSGIAGEFLRGAIVPAIDDVTTGHDHLVNMIGQAKTGLPLRLESFTRSMGFETRDAIEDYHAVLLSLRLQSKQIGFLLATRKLFPDLEWHDCLGPSRIDNRLIKKELGVRLAVIRQENYKIEDIKPMVDVVDQEITDLPDEVNREYTALQIAEALQLLVGNSKPGRFGATWNNTFRSSTSPDPQNFVMQWLGYICSNNGRDRFIAWTIAQATDSYNNNPWVKYFLKEYEFCLSGRSAHRNASFEIEHFFPSSWEDSNYSLDVARHGFTGCEQYKQSFVDRIGNKLVLDKDLNAAMKNYDPSVRVSCYRTQAYASVNVMRTNPSESAISIANDLSGAESPEQYRVYVQLRSLRLAVFAARRF